MIEERELLVADTLEETIDDYQQGITPQGNRTALLKASRRRTSTADLMKAHLALMEKEVILPKQSDLFRLVKYHYYTLQSWHDQHTGWRIQRDANAIRLIRYPSATTPGYLYDRLKEPGDFACLTWILWYAESRQLTGRGNDQQFEYTDVVRSLIVALNQQLVAMVVDKLNDPTTTLQPAILLSPAGAALPSLLRAWRALLLGPALFRFDDPTAFAELLVYADAIANELLETFGWLLDIHRDYACVVRASGMATGPVTSLTPFGTNDQIALLLCKAIRDQIEAAVWPSPDRYGCLHVTTEDMSELFYSVRERYGENWGSEARSKSSRSLLHDVYRKMRQVGLLLRSGL